MKNIPTDSFITSLVQDTFAELPYLEVLKLLKEKQLTLKSEEIYTKYKDERFSVSDLLSQSIFIDYFMSTELFEYVNIGGEESTDNLPTWDNNKEYSLFIDPIDGGPAYLSGGNDWGIMIGVCNKMGENIYSWFTTSDAKVIESKKIIELQSGSFAERAQKGKNFSIDLFAYNEIELVEGAKKEITKLAGEKIGLFLEYSSWPAVLYAAHHLVIGNSAGLLWLPSITGKGFYPDYDCVFFDAIQKAGFKIKIARREVVVPESEGKIAMIAVASVYDDLELLWQAGINVLGDRFDVSWKISTDHLIII